MFPEHIGMLRLLGLCWIGAGGWVWRLFGIGVYPRFALKMCHQLPQELLWSGSWRFVLPFLQCCICDCLVSWIVQFLQRITFCILLMPHCPLCVFLVWQILLLLGIPIVPGKLLSLIPLFCFSLVLHKYNFHQSPLTPLCICFHCLVLRGSIQFGKSGRCCWLGLFWRIHPHLGCMFVVVSVFIRVAWCIFFAFGGSDILALLLHVSFLYFVWCWKVFVHCFCCEYRPGDVFSYSEGFGTFTFNWESCSCMEVLYTLFGWW